MPAKKHGNILRGIGKTLGIAAITYQTTKQVTNGKEGTTTNSNNLLPAIGLGAVVSYKDFLPKKHKQLSIAYKLYDKNMQLVQAAELPIKKQVPAIKGTAPKNGYIEAFVIDKSQVIPQLSFESADIDIMPLPKPSLVGGIANDLQLTTYGECLGNGEGGEYDGDGYDSDGYDRDGYDRDGYDRDGYDVEGYDKDGYDRDGYDVDGYDKDGYDRDGYDRDGYDRDGYDKDGNTRGDNGPSKCKIACAASAAVQTAAAHATYQLARQACWDSSGGMPEVYEPCLALASSAYGIALAAIGVSYTICIWGCD